MNDALTGQSAMPAGWRATLRQRWLRESVGPLLIIISVVSLFSDLAVGHFPVSHDHPAHMFNAWLTSDVLLPQGELRGWTDLWFAGYPANELYGPGGNLWVAAVRWATFKQLSFGATYGLSLLLLMLMLPLATYTLGRAWFGPVAGTFAGLLLAFTRGSWYDLGWFWVLEMGVWPFALGAAFTLFALIVFRRYLRRGGPRGLAAASFGFALAIVGHPMSLLLLGIAGPIVMLFVVLEDSSRRVMHVARRGAFTVILGSALCASWLVPFVGKSSYTQKLGETWFELHKVLSELIQLDLYGPEWRIVLGLAAVGIFLAIARRQLWVLCLAVIAVVMLLFSTTTVQYDLRLFDVLGNLASIQYPRFVGVVRILVYLIAGYTISIGVELLVARWREYDGSVWSRRALTVVLFAVGLPLVAQLPQYLGHNHTPDEETLVTEAELGWWADYVTAANWLRDKPGRIAAFQEPSDHVFSTLPMLTGQPVYTGGFVPAHTYRFFFEGRRDPKWLPALGVKWVMTLGKWRGAPKGAKERETFGRVRVYELATEPMEPISTRDGTCDVRLVRFADEQIVARVTKVESPCRVVLHRSDFPNWQARFDGKATSLERAAVIPGADYSPFMSVWVTAPGTLDVRWESVKADDVGVRVATVGWLWLFALLVFSVRRHWWARGRGYLAARLAPLQSGLEWATRIALVLIVIGGVALGMRRARETHYTFDRHVAEAERGVLVKDELQSCESSDNGRGWTCGEKWDLIRTGVFSYVYDSRYCIYAHPSPRGPKVLRFKNVPLKSRISGFFGLLDTSQGRGDVRFSIRVDENPPVEFSTSKTGDLKGFEVLTREGPQDVEFRIEARKPAWRHFCFNAQVVD